MIKFKGRSKMSQYFKVEPIKWRFKWWFWCVNSTGYLHKFHLYLGPKKDGEFNLGEGVVMQVSEKVKGTYCILFFEKTFNSPALINNLFWYGIYAIGTVVLNWKQMAKLKEDNKMSSGETDLHYSKTSFAANGTTSQFSFWQQMLMVWVGYLM